MLYMTSRNFVLPATEDKMAETVWFNMWQRRLWPYHEAVSGDLLYWYCSASATVAWKTRLLDIERFEYGSKEEAARRIEQRFDRSVQDDAYFRDAPSKGYCISFKVQPIERLGIKKPQHLKMPYEGWLKITPEIMGDWLGGQAAVDEPMLDDIAPVQRLAQKESLLDKLRRINERMVGILPERVVRLVSETIRRDTSLVKAIKEACEFRCQFPGCSVRIPKRSGGFYAEVAHIEPMHKGGRSMIGNLVVLCPNHHKELDYGTLEIAEQSLESVTGKLNGREFRISFPRLR
jgi:hypothetical protein